MWQWRFRKILWPSQNIWYFGQFLGCSGLDNFQNCFNSANFRIEVTSIWLIKITWNIFERIIGAATKVRGRSMIFSIKPKFNDQFFVDLHALYKLQTWTCSASSANQNKKQFHVCALYISSKSTKNRLSNFDIIEKAMSYSLLAVRLMGFLNLWFSNLISVQLSLFNFKADFFWFRLSS